jgi:hypothetical protein
MEAVEFTGWNLSHIWFGKMKVFKEKWLLAILLFTYYMADTQEHPGNGML